MERLPTSEKDTEARRVAASEEYNTIVTEISLRLEHAGLSMNEARSYARQAIAAYPNDHNIDILFGYAMALYKAADKSE